MALFLQVKRTTTLEWSEYVNETTSASGLSVLDI